MSRKFLSIVIGVALSIFILRNPLFHEAIQSLGDFGYFGGFVAGIFYTSVFTAVPATAVFLLLADTSNFFILSLLGGLGAVVGDYIIYRFFQRETEEVINSRVIKNFHFAQLIKKIPIIRPLAIVIGAVIVASPFPDELGIALLGVSRLTIKKFLPLSFILNTAGIFVVVGLGKII